MCRILAREPYRCELCSRRFFLPAPDSDKVVRVASDKAGTARSRDGQVRTGVATDWAHRHMLLIAGLGLTTVLGAVAAIEVYESRNRPPVMTIAPRRPNRYIVIRRITPPSEPTPFSETNKGGGPVRKPQETSQE